MANLGTIPYKSVEGGSSPTSRIPLLGWGSGPAFQTKMPSSHLNFLHRHLPGIN